MNRYNILRDLNLITVTNFCYYGSSFISLSSMLLDCTVILKVDYFRQIQIRQISAMREGKKYFRILHWDKPEMRGKPFLRS